MDLHFHSLALISRRMIADAVESFLGSKQPYSCRQDVSGFLPSARVTIASASAWTASFLIQGPVDDLGALDCLLVTAHLADHSFGFVGDAKQAGDVRVCLRDPGNEFVRQIFEA